MATATQSGFLQKCIDVLREASDALNADVAASCGCLATPEQAGVESFEEESVTYARMAASFREDLAKFGEEFEVSEHDLLTVLDACRISAFELLLQASFRPALKDEAYENALECAKLALDVRYLLCKVRK